MPEELHNYRFTYMERVPHGAWQRTETLRGVPKDAAKAALLKLDNDESVSDIEVEELATNV
jgi:hypothetical protein